RDAAWSHSDADLLYCHSNTQLYAVTASSGAQAFVADFNGQLGTEQLDGMRVDGADEVFTFITRDSTGVALRAFAYERSTDTLHVRDYAGDTLDGAQLDHGGVYVVGNFDTRWDVWDFGADAVTPVNADGVERGGLCPQVTGTNLLVGGDCWDGGFLARTLDAPLAWTHILSLLGTDGNPQWDFVTDLSLNQSDERWFLVSFWTDGTGPVLADWQPWEQEIVAVATDGTWALRLAHHHSDVVDGGWEASPRATISFDGRHALFTSNFDGGGRDVFLLDVPEICP
ncbi:MAG TPA: hypothetical protein VG389_20065, partial [Myxococcota bacterium]|nr:hypothetical protein [Myxococcota bacterium]